MIGQKIGYVRVSTIDQVPERQLQGLKLDKVFLERASASTTDRPELKNLLLYAREGDKVYVDSIDRLARNIIDLRKIIDELQKKNVQIEFVKEKISTDDANPMNMLFLNLMGVFAEFERSMMLQRQKEGIAIAKAKGRYQMTRVGRKPCLDADQTVQVKKLIEDGYSKVYVARKFGVTRQILYKYLKMEKQNDPTISNINLGMAID